MTVHELTRELIKMPPNAEISFWNDETGERLTFGGVEKCVTPDPREDGGNEVVIQIEVIFNKQNYDEE